jgi:hypothetical protein
MCQHSRSNTNLILSVISSITAPMRVASISEAIEELWLLKLKFDRILKYFYEADSQIWPIARRNR